MTTPRSSKFKIAFTGTNSSGKTTMAMEVTSRLKSENHYLAELVSSQDRKISWKDEHFPVDPRAHYGMITNLIHAEVQAELKGDANVVVTDRSVLDLYSIALVDHPNHPMIAALRPTVEAWLTSYTKVFYLPPLEYQEDGKRPPNEFRMQTHASLINEIEKGNFPNLEMISDRSTIMGKVREVLGIHSPNPQVLAFDEKLQFVADCAKVTLAVKQRKWATSDLDLWVVGEHQAMSNLATTKLLLDLVLGDAVTTHVMFLPSSALRTLCNTHKIQLFHVKV